MNPYDVKMTPAVGGGLPGLPRRLHTTQKIVLSGKNNLRRFLEPCGDQYPVSSGINQWSSYLGVYPCRDTPGIGLLASYDTVRGSGKQYAYIGFRYGTSGMELGTPLSMDSQSYQMRNPAILSGGRYLYNRYNSSDFYLVTLNPKTLELTESKLFTNPNTGTLDTGETYTLSNVWNAVSGSQYYRTIFVSRHDTFLFFDGVTVDGAFWIVAFEYGMGGDFIAARRLFAPAVTAGGVQKSLTTQRIGSWYYLHFMDVGPGSSYTVNFSCYAVQEGFGQILKLRQGTAVPSTSANSPRILADDRSIMFVAWNSAGTTINNVNSWILELDATGGPTSTGTNIGLLGTSFTGESVRDASLFGKQHDPATGLYLSPESTPATLAVGLCRQRGIFYATPDATTGFADALTGFAYRYSTQNKVNGSLLVTIDDAVLPACAGVQRLYPLENGLWFGILSNPQSSSTYYYQMFQEV